MIHRTEGAFGDAGLIVLRPSSNDRVECGHESLLWCPSMPSYPFPYLLVVSFDRLLARLDDGLESCLAAIGARPVLAYVVLSHVEAQKVKPILGMGDSGLFQIQFQMEFILQELA